MTDNLFDRLADLFGSSGPVNWRLAREIAESMAGPAEPIDPWAAEELRDLAATAQRIVAAGSPLDPIAAEIRVMGRRQWAGENVDAFAYVAEPLADRLADGGGGLPPPLEPLGPALIGMQIGALTGTLSHRALGQFDTGLPAGSRSPVTFVLPNLSLLGADHGLDDRQVRMWVALREVAHHGILAVPWVHEHLLMVAHQHVEGLDLDPESIARRLEVFQDPEALQRLVDTPEGFPAFEPLMGSSGSSEGLRALAAVIDGYGDHLVARTGASYLPDLTAIRRAAHHLRAASADNEQVLLQVLGVTVEADADHDGASFCADVSRRWGDESLDRMWEGPEMLPSWDELSDTTGWAARVLL